MRRPGGRETLGSIRKAVEERESRSRSFGRPERAKGVKIPLMRRDTPSPSAMRQHLVRSHNQDTV